MKAQESLFIGVFPTGLNYCDKRQDVRGDYKVIAFLPFAGLELEVYDPKSELLPAIKRDVEIMQAKAGQSYQVSTCGQTVRLGGGQ